MERFKHPFHKQLKANNLWVKLAELIPWYEMAGIYSRNLDVGTGRLRIDIRKSEGADKFDHEKNGYSLNQIRAKWKNTSESWISVILFVMNLAKLMKVTVEYGNFLVLFALRILRITFSPVVIYDWIPVDQKRALPA